MGSGHCVAMCGGLVIATTRSRSDLIRYHLGRLGGYLSLGALGGALGSVSTQWAEGMSWVAASLMAASFVFAGIQVWKGRSLHLQFVSAPLLSKLFKKAADRPLMTGSLSALLPCGWLHTFVLGAVATQSPLKGAAFLLVFWVGTLPALGLAPWLIEKFISPVILPLIKKQSPKWAALLLIFVGVWSLGIKVVPLTLNHTLSHSMIQGQATAQDASSPEGSCH